MKWPSRKTCDVTDGGFSLGRWRKKIGRALVKRPCRNNVTAAGFSLGRWRDKIGDVLVKKPCRENVTAGGLTPSGATVKGTDHV